MLFIKNGRIIDPGANIDINAGLLVRDGMIAPLSALPADLRGVDVLDAEGLIVAPGLVDMHVHFP